MERRPPRRPPVERVRARLRGLAGEDAASALPRGYQRLGDVLLLRLPPGLDRWGPEIGTMFREELGVETVLAFDGPMEGESRHPQVRRLAGERTETTVREEGVVYHLDAARTMFAQGNKTERRRAGALVRPGEVVADLFAGIGYFTVPAAKFGRPRRVYAVEREACPYGYLVRNLAANHVEGRATPLRGDCRDVELPKRSFDRVFLGYLPSSLEFVPRSLELLRPQGGWLHLHLVVSAPGWEATAGDLCRRAVDRARGRTTEVLPRRVKPYGPSRVHAVVDLRAVPPP